MIMENERIIVIDGNSLINRAYYAMQRPMITKEGIYTQGIYGFINMLTKIKNDYSPEYIAIAFDRKAPTMRHLEYENYKAGRKKMPPELAMQLPLLKEILSAMKIKMFELDGFEADDIIGTIVVRAEQQGLNALIITGDKDELQLVTEKTHVIITRKGITEFDYFDLQAMHDKYGFSPKTFIDYKGLMGDQSDNIPGIPGVGEKTASKLLEQFGSIENLIENVNEIKNEKMRNKVQENAHLAIMSKRLATINVNVPIEIDFEDMRVLEPDLDELVDLYKKLEFNSFLKKLDVTKVEGEKSKKFEIDCEIVRIETEDAWEHQKSYIKKSNKVFINILSDDNHIGFPQIYGLAILANEKYIYIDGEHIDLIRTVLKFILQENIKLCGYNLKREYFLIFKLLDNNLYCNFNTSCDIAIAAYVLNPSKSNYDLKALMLEYMGIDLCENINSQNEEQLDLFIDKREQYLNTALNQCWAVKSLEDILENIIKENDLLSVYKDIELPLVEIIAFMEYTGISVDKEELISAGKELSENISEITKEIYELAGENFNINSPMQLGNILFEKLGLQASKKTKKGYSTNAEVLEKLRDSHPIIDLILKYRSLTKLNGTYVEGLIPLIAEDNKIHAHFMQTVTATGRISCTEPNLQNIPIRHEVGRKLRKAFIPAKEYSCFTGADYSQIELRVLAHMADDESLIESFAHGDDIHKITASKVFNVPIDDVTSLQRSAAKAVNFGVIYGMSSFGLSGEINVTRKEAERYIEDYFREYSAVKQFMDREVEFCKNNGYVKTIMNRRRYINEITASNFMVRQAGERLAMNSPIQGSAADIIKLAMISVYKALKENNLKSRLVLQVHDELIIETAEGEEKQVELLLRECMETAVKLKVDLVVSLNNGANWYELK